MKIGLRIDVDTFRGTRDGVPRLLQILAAHGIKGTFFFTVGPDNMGRHLWRLVRPTFFWKMLRSRAGKLYGWDILLRGTLWPGPVIGERLADVIRATADAGHEIGLHAWDHHAWQAHVDEWDGPTIHDAISRGVEALTRILGRPPECSAAPGWRCNDRVLLEKERFGFRYNSDCRGSEVFVPVVDGRALGAPQVPTTLPTYDEIVGRDGITNDTYNDHLLSRVSRDGLNVLTLHAEVEGNVCADMFDEFVGATVLTGGEFVPLRALLADVEDASRAALTAQLIPGREGPVAVQVAHRGASRARYEK